MAHSHYAARDLDPTCELCLVAQTFAPVGRLTVADLEAAYSHEHPATEACSGEWLGWGYLGERRSAAADPNVAVASIAAADAAVLEAANAAGFDVEQLFGWLNSREGRHFADQALYSAEGIARGFAWELGPGQAGFSRRRAR